MKSTGGNAPKEKRPFLFYPILVNNKTRIVSTISENEFIKIYNIETRSFDYKFLEELKVKYEQLGESFLMPITDGKGMSWRWSRTKVEKECNEIIVLGSEENFSLYKKQRPELGDLPTAKPKSILNFQRFDITI